MKWKELLKFSWKKLILSIIIALIWSSLRYIITITSTNTFILENNTEFNIVYLVLVLLFNAFLFYPFSSALYYLSEKYKQKKLFSGIKEKKILVCLIFLNPLIVYFILGLLFVVSMSFRFSQSPGIECGVYIVDIFPNSPAESAGLKEGMIIHSIDQIQIENIKDFVEIFNTKKPGDKILVTAYRTESIYKKFEQGEGILIILEKNPLSDSVFLGINFTQYYSKTEDNCN